MKTTTIWAGRKPVATFIKGHKTNEQFVTAMAKDGIYATGEKVSQEYWVPFGTFYKKTRSNDAEAVPVTVARW